MAVTDSLVPDYTPPMDAIDSLIMQHQLGSANAANLSSPNIDSLIAIHQGQTEKGAPPWYAPNAWSQGAANVGNAIGTVTSMPFRGAALAQHAIDPTFFNKDAQAAANNPQVMQTAQGIEGFLKNTWPGQWLTGALGTASALPMLGAVKNFANGYTNVAGQATGILPEALNRAVDNPAALQANVGMEPEIGAGMVKNLFHPQQALPEARQVAQILPSMPGINPANVVNVFDNELSRVAKNTNNDQTPMALQQIQARKQWYIDNFAQRDGKGNIIVKTPDGNFAAADTRPDGTLNGEIQFNPIPAPQFNSLRQSLDQDVPWGMPHYEDYDKAALAARTQMKEDLIDGAPPEYSPLMQSWSDKLGKIEAARDIFGSNEEKASINAPRVISSIFNKGNEPKLQRLQALDDVFPGNEWLQNAKDAYLAKQFGETGIPQWLTSYKTGRANYASIAGAGLGSAIGLATKNPGAGAAVGGAIGTAMGSPRLQTQFAIPAARAIGTGMNALSPFTTALPAVPAASGIGSLNLMPNYQQ